jgi:hypothetical protein
MNIMDALRSIAGIAKEPTEAELLELIERLRNCASHVVGEMSKSLMTCPRWTAIAKTDLQTAIMALERAVTKPEKF